MRSYDSPRDYRTALGPNFGTRRIQAASGTNGMSPVTLSARLMIAIERGRSPQFWQEDDHDESTAQSVRSQLGQAAA